MNRGDFLRDSNVGGFLGLIADCEIPADINGYPEDLDGQGFLGFFGRCLHFLEVEYNSHYTKILPANRHFYAIGVDAALQQYAWPAINTFVGAPIYDWIDTSAFLGMARIALQNSIATGNDIDTWDVVEKILRWGLGHRAGRSLARLRTICHPHGPTISAYLDHIRATLTLNVADTLNINAHLIPYASSGMSKVHSLASNDGLVIFDSRVAATLGECINEYLRRNTALAIPASLKIFHAAGRCPLPLGNGANHPPFVRNHSWIECQVRVSWLFQAVLTMNPTVFPGLPMPDRMHRLEAALFMMGAYLAPGAFAERSFNFNRV